MDGMPLEYKSITVTRMYQIDRKASTIASWWSRLDANGSSVSKEKMEEIIKRDVATITRGDERIMWHGRDGELSMMSAYALALGMAGNPVAKYHCENVTESL